MSLDETVTTRTLAPRRDALRRSSRYERLAAAIERRLPAALAGQMLRFALVGVFNTALSLCLFALAIDVGVWYPAASVAAFIAGAINGYTLNRVWTFRSGSASASRFGRYAIVQLIGLAMNLIVLRAMVEGLSSSRLLGQLVALLVVSACTFMLNRQWAFATSPAAPRS